MTILVAYVPRPDGDAALEKGMELARRQDEHLVVVNASAGGGEDPAAVDVAACEQVQQRLQAAGISAEWKQLVRGKSAVEEILWLVESMRVSLLIIGIRHRSPLGKLFLGSVAQELLLSVPCPIMAVKAQRH